MQVETILIAGQVAWEMLLIVIFSAILSTIFYFVTEQSAKRKKS